MQKPAPSEVVSTFFETAARAEDLSVLGTLVSEDIDWYVAGDTAHVPWIGRKIGRAGVAEFYQQIRQYIQSEKFTLSQIIASGNSVFATGELASRVRSTGKLIESEFIFSFQVEDGVIVRFRLFEDSYAVSRACR